MTREDASIHDPGAPGGGRAPGPLRRAELYGDQLTGDSLRPQTPWARLGAWLGERATTRAVRQEHELQQRLASLARGLTRTAHVAVLSPKGGVGKTTCTLLAGDALARHGRLRCVAVDANPDYGTLGSLAPDAQHAERSQEDLLEHAGQIAAPGELRPFLATLESGLHILAGPTGARASAAMTPERYAQLIGLLERFYEVILLDLGTGLSDPLVRFALTTADQTVVVCTPEWVTADRVLAALDDLQGTSAAERLTLVLNQAPAGEAVDRQVLEAAFRRHELAAQAAIPYDPLLRRMLDAGAYHPGQLSRPTRLAVLELAVAVAEGLR